jgi:3-mercaptopyruvate sulfurtransferase SseA
VALLLRSKGVQKIRPLAGGLDGWRKMGYPVVTADQKPTVTSIAPAPAADSVD